MQVWLYVVCVCIYVCMCVYVCICACVWREVYVSVCVCTLHLRICVFLLVHTCVYV